MAELRPATQRLLGIFAAVVCLAGTAYSPLDYGSVSGFAKGPSGTVAHKVNVTVNNEAKTGQERSPITNDAGCFVATDIPPGPIVPSAVTATQVQSQELNGRNPIYLAQYTGPEVPKQVYDRGLPANLLG